MVVRSASSALATAMSASRPTCGCYGSMGKRLKAGIVIGRLGSLAWGLSRSRADHGMSLYAGTYHSQAGEPSDTVAPAFNLNNAYDALRPRRRLR
jgi:hypothetical protein